MRNTGFPDFICEGFQKYDLLIPSITSVKQTLLGDCMKDLKFIVFSGAI